MIYSKTASGHQVMKDRSVPLTPRQRSAFILVDGKRTQAQILVATAAMGVTREDIDKLAELGLIEDLAPDQTKREVAVAAAFVEAIHQHKQRSDKERFAEAYPIAAKLTGALGLRGFRLNLAVEAAGDYQALLALAPKIRDAVGEEKYRPLDDALNDR